LQGEIVTNYKERRIEVHNPEEVGLFRSPPEVCFIPQSNAAAREAAWGLECIIAMSHFLSLAEAVEATLRDGDTVAMEGFTHLIPFTVGHSPAATKSHPHPDFAVTSASIFRRSITTSSASFARLPESGSLRCRRSGRMWGDPRAQSGSCRQRLIEGIVGVQKEIVLVAQRSIVTVEEIVDDLGARSANAVILPSWTVGAIACVLGGGAHPSYAHGYYKRDNAYYKAWDAISRGRDGFLAWMKSNVLEVGPDAFALPAHGGGMS
jgi:hypothetical protein